MTLSTIALGGNLGSVATTFNAALSRLESKETTVRAVSSFHATAPVGAQAGTAFLNAAASIETSLSPLKLLDQLQAIETALGRTRELRWGPRTLDLDLLFYANDVIENPRLIVPHPAAWYRRFVLDPLVEIIPEFVHPVKGVTIRNLRERLLTRPLPVALTGLSTDAERDVADQLHEEFPQVAFSRWNADSDEKSADGPALLVWFGPGECSKSTFEQLPLVPRFDASRSNEETVSLLRHLLHAALGE